VADMRHTRRLTLKCYEQKPGVEDGQEWTCKTKSRDSPAEAKEPAGDTKDHKRAQTDLVQ